MNMLGNTWQLYPEILEKFKRYLSLCSKNNLLQVYYEWAEIEFVVQQGSLRELINDVSLFCLILNKNEH